MLKNLLLAILFAVLSLPTLAQQPIDSPEVFGALETARDQGWTPQLARNVIRAMVVDGNISVVDRKILSDLSKGPTDPLTVILPLPDGQKSSLAVSLPTGRARALFRVTSEVSNGANLNEYWLVEGKMQDFFLLSTAADPVNKRLQNFVMSKYLEAWQKGTPENAHKPFRDLLTKSWSFLPKAEADLEFHLESGNLIYKSVRRLDAYLKDQIPDHRYNWMHSKPID